MTRVLIVDDSAVVRLILTRILASDPELEVVGTASNGAQALEQVVAADPDLVTLDIEMPVMDGLTALSELRSRGFAKPVIMLSSLAGPGAEATLDALARGATDFVTKPTCVGHGASGLDAIGPELIRKIKGLCTPSAAAEEPALATTPAAPRVERPAPEIIVIATSTGGPAALAQVVPLLPEGLRIPVVIVQHMPPVFTERLARNLDGRCALEVREARDGAKLFGGSVWIAPGDHHLEIRGGAADERLHLHQGPPENSVRPAADPLFRSVANTYGSRALAIVLTGMGQDGCEGARAIQDAGGEVVVQDRESSVVWGMPGFVAAAGLAHAVLPLAEIAPLIARRAQTPVR